MSFEMNNTMVSQDITELQKLIGKCITSYVATEFNGMYLAVKFQVDTNLYLLNVPTGKQDHDEYPIFSLTTSPENEYKWDELCVGELERVSIIRDEVKWVSEEHIEWRVSQDVGVKFYFNNYEVLVVSVDSGAGFVNCTINTTVEVPNSPDDMLDYWEMKTDVLDSWERTEIAV
ncbi:hypothetical protein OS242_08975 [Tumebacillus sp. DT12]|uniref:Uncharacterized protein n=1 Tax=Tumebacillus lacus TaxID=2995335 RepID=A0ABT3X2T1_9BACL|nr:hypothetical protein [Tumebacillus lacus]MCX7570097.1 hypothetical protein [Tumebacillus lacus]